MIIGAYVSLMERVLLVELQMLGDILGPDSDAGRVLKAVRKLRAPLILWSGRRLFICEMATEDRATQDTLVMRRWW